MWYTKLPLRGFMITRVTNLLGWCSKNDVASIDDVASEAPWNTGDSRDSPSLWWPKKQNFHGIISPVNEVIYQPVSQRFHCLRATHITNYSICQLNMVNSRQVSKCPTWPTMPYWVGSSIRAPTVMLYREFFRSNSLPCSKSHHQVAKHQYISIAINHQYIWIAIHVYESHGLPSGNETWLAWKSTTNASMVLPRMLHRRLSSHVWWLPPFRVKH